MSMTNVNGEKVRFSFATNPLLNRSIEWELNGTYNGLATDLQQTHLAVLRLSRKLFTMTRKFNSENYVF